VRRQVNASIRRSALPIAADARDRAQNWGAPTVAGIAAGSRAGQAVIRQRKGKTTGRRPDFGARQMAMALMPAAVAGMDQVTRAADSELKRIIES
jgi:hypothetical protein